MNTIIGIIDCIGRLKVKTISEEQAQHRIGFCNYLYTTDYNMKTWDNYDTFNWRKGFGDVFVNMKTKNTTTSLRTLDNGQQLYLGNASYSSGEEVDICPKNILAAAVRKLSKLNLRLKVGVELEFYLFYAGSDSPPKPIVDYDTDYDYIQLNQMFEYWDELKVLLHQADIRMEGIKCECGKGQIELTMVYGDAEQIADNVIIAKHMIKAFFLRKGLTASFMAKPSIDDAGSGLHLHLTMHDIHNDLVLSGEDNRWKPFVLGIVQQVNEWMCFYAPNHNSYKRLKNRSWAPVNTSLETDNRSSMIRIISEEKGHFEFRLPGADVNIHLTLAAIIHSGISGMDAYPSAGEVLFKNHLANFQEAVTNFHRSAIVRDSLGPEIHQHYSQFYLNESNSLNELISDTELRRYLRHA